MTQPDSPAHRSPAPCFVRDRLTASPWTWPATASMRSAQLCTAAGDKASLAIATAGLMMHTLIGPDPRKRRDWHRKPWAEIESRGDPHPLRWVIPCGRRFGKVTSAEYLDVLRWSERVVELAQTVTVRQLRYRVSVSARLGDAGLLPVGAWVTPDGRNDFLQRPRPWPAAPTPCSDAAGSSLRSIPGKYRRTACSRPDDSAVRQVEDALLDNSRTNAGDDPRVTIDPDGAGLLRRYSAKRLRSVTADKVLARGQRMFRRWRHNLCDLPIVEVVLGA